MPQNIYPISIIIPAYNEEKTIVAAIDDIKSELSNKFEYELIVVNDGSTDRTKEVLSQIDGINFLNHKMNLGYSSSLKTGINNARYDWILTTDGDGSHLANQISRLTPFMDEYDLIIGARTSKDAYDTSSRRFGRNIIAIFAQYISHSKIDDINSGFRLFKKSLSKRFWHLFPERFSFSTTITVAAHVNHYAVKYVPIEVHKRKGGSSSIKPAKDFLGFLNIIARLAIYFKPLKVFVPLSLLFFIIAISTVMIDYFLTGMILDTTFAILVTTGIQMLVFGFIAEMIVKRFYND
jgi:glycosyltransferase involved in cell wall biosynthesis